MYIGRYVIYTYVVHRFSVIIYVLANMPILSSQHSSQSGQVRMDGDKFKNKMNNSHLWNDASDHAHWITRLVTSLLISGGVTDEVLLLLMPVCEIKVSLILLY